MNNYYNENELEAGIDESGLGPLCGAVYAAVVILPHGDEYNPELFDMINDSKKLSKKKKDILEKYIKCIAIDYGVASVDEKTIDKVNVLQAKFIAMHKALDQLNIIPDRLLVDGNCFKMYVKDGEVIPHVTIVGGDRKYKSIAAASILAKCARDRYIEELDKEFPQYNWKKNKGYGTKEHINAIKEYGICKYHRKSFNLKL